MEREAILFFVNLHILVFSFKLSFHLLLTILSHREHIHGLLYISDSFIILGTGLHSRLFQMVSEINKETQFGKSYDILPKKHFILCQLRRECCASHGAEDGGQCVSEHFLKYRTMFSFCTFLPSGDTVSCPCPLFLASGLLPN